ncbi:hypothetical protein GPECTOR_81g223 [Gonium pectorale]|uniref:Uncharacterized protein n=1 Tax=Gonium pectorale TaxID=33097 RepID=A0A150G1R7_GONPE|nr:hypothetical protein GPECTOR_81g223 [Gonium pectorale]|eukprot:KXZ43773.1 hypothetical protein GPECTOR_81g223 [Gonium pectorale]
MPSKPTTPHPFAANPPQPTQVTGRYAVNTPSLQPLAARVRRLWGGFEDIAIQHVPRASNRLADLLSNLAMDAEEAVAEADRDARFAAAVEPAVGDAARGGLAAVLAHIGEPALSAAREAAAASAAAARASVAISTSADGGGSSRGGGWSGGGAAGGRGPKVRVQRSVTECAAPLAARGSRAGGSEEHFKRVLLALAALGHGLLQ